MPRYLKRGMDASAIKAADAKVRSTVESILAKVEAGRDQAVRALSEKFDNWSPESFRLSATDIERAIAKLSMRDLDMARWWSRMETIIPYRRKRVEGGGLEVAKFWLKHLPHLAWRQYCRAYVWFRKLQQANRAHEAKRVPDAV